jgi:hypothetical protein
MFLAITQRSQRYAEIAEKTSSPYKDHFSCKAPHSLKPQGKTHSYFVRSEIA